jgi:hypothetical protein
VAASFEAPATKVRTPRSTLPSLKKTLAMDPNPDIVNVRRGKKKRGKKERELYEN